MSDLFPIRFWHPLEDATMKTTVFSATVPFIHNDEWFSITQEDHQHISSLRTYAIDKLPTNHLPTVPPISYQQVNWVELGEAIKFMMNAFAREVEKRNVQSICQQVALSSDFEREPILWNRPIEVSSEFGSFHHDHSTSTSDDLDDDRRRKSVAFNLNDKTDRATQYEKQKLTAERSNNATRVDPMA